MATLESLQARQNAIAEQYREHADFVHDVQEQAEEELIPALKDEFGLDDEAVGDAKAFLHDRVSVFRFCRRARFSPSASLKLLHATLSWRLTSSFSSLTPASIPALYFTTPLLFFHPSLRDKFGRPCAVLNLRHVQRTEDGSLDGLKEYAKLVWEVGRRYLSDLSRDTPDEPKLQMVLIVDLAGAGYSNLELELLPFFLDLLKQNFPGMVGGLFILNYGWAYAGMWQVAKRVLPSTALERILFPSKDELLEFFEEDHLLVEHGGKVQYEYSPGNPILEKYGRPLHPLSRPPSARPSAAPTPSASSSSLHQEVFHSAAGSRNHTPALSRRPSGLIMTSAGLRTGGHPAAPGWPWNWGFTSSVPAAEPESVGGLRRVRSLAELQQKLEQTQRELDSDDSIVDSASEVSEEATDLTQPERFDVDSPAVTAGSAAGSLSARSSRFSSRYSSRAASRAVSRTVSRDVSPMRRRALEPLKMTTGEEEAAEQQPELHPMSPYNPSNPHFGYAGYVPPSSLDPYRQRRPVHFRRRKRDLLRTLTYLAVLRLLALHRAFRYRLSVLIATLLRLTGLGWLQARRARRAAAKQAQVGGAPAVATPLTDRKVHWAASPASSSTTTSGSMSPAIPPQPHSHTHPSSAVASSPFSRPSPPPPLFDLDPTVVYVFLLFLFIRTPRKRDKLRRLGRFVVLEGPRWAVQPARRAALRVLLGKEGARGALKLERARRAG
ncbi:hypothetical protein JCM8097_009287 [Rhodosporidiobolus ruineniae]